MRAIAGALAKLSAWALLALMALAAGVLAYVAWGFWASLPKLDGQMQVAGLSSPVRIVRDENGVPHVLGATEADVSFGLGYAHAQDRFFQMDLLRRIGEGRLSALIGEPGYQPDVQAHTRNWPDIVARQTAALPPALRGALEAYAAGVNARLRHGMASPEYALLFARPERWRVEDSIACGLALVADQTGSRIEEVWRAALASDLSATQLARFFPDYPAWGPAVLESAADGAGGARAAEAGRAGSNAWVVSGARTTTGRPLMASDPHVALSEPANFYLARLATPAGDFVGATLPGVPFIVMGRGPAGAFAVTNGEIDAEDFVLISQASFDNAAIRRADIEVRGLFGPSRRSIEIRETPVGPVVDPSAFEETRAFGTNAHVALRSAADDPGNRAFEALYLLGHARSASAVREAARLMRAPALNLLYAGADGSIGYALAGVLPIRDANGVWIEDLPEHERPSIVDPASGEIISANNPPTRETRYRGYFMAERALRISEWLRRSPRHDAREFVSLQHDVVSDIAMRFKVYIAQATPSTQAGIAMQRALARWEGEMRADRREPLLYTAWLRELGTEIYGDEIGRENLSLFPRTRAAFLLSVLEHDDAAWCDDITTARKENCSDAASIALDRAAISVPDGNWGDVHIARFEHPLLSSVPLLSALYAIRQPVGGDSTTVNMTRLAPGSSYESDFGAAYRAVYELGELDRSRFMLAPGQSGHPFSPYYRNLVGGWAAGETFEIRGRHPGGPPPNARHTFVLLTADGGGVRRAAE